jgi:hypothetical protein
MIDIWILRIIQGELHRFPPLFDLEREAATNGDNIKDALCARILSSRSQGVILEVEADENSITPTVNPSLHRVVFGQREVVTFRTADLPRNLANTTEVLTRYVNNATSISFSRY